MAFNCTTCDTTAIVTETLASASLMTGGVTAINSFFLGASLNLLFGLINMVQLYTHYPLIDIVFPGNIFSILSAFISIASLDLMTDENFFSNTLDYNPQDGMVAYNERFELLGYDTTSIVYNLGDMSLL